MTADASTLTSTLEACSNTSLPISYSCFFEPLSKNLLHYFVLCSLIRNFAVEHRQQALAEAAVWNILINITALAVIRRV